MTAAERPIVGTGLLSRAAFVDAINPRLSATLDLSRWLAAFLVLVFHVRLNTLVEPKDLDPAQQTVWIRAVYAVTEVGPQAVIWFFVISGFLVGGKVIADIRQDRFGFADYALDRISRLYIVLLPALAIGYALDRLRIHWFGMTGVGDETAASYPLATFIGNLFNQQNILVPTLGSNVPLWSLAFEAAYYLAFPLLLAPLMPRLGTVGRIFAFALGLAYLGYLTLNMTLLGAFPIWLLGVAIRFCPFALTRSPVVGWSIALMALLLYPSLYGRFGHAADFVVALAFANVLLTAMHAESKAPKYGAIHARLAGFSYSLYLVHAPFIHFLVSVWLSPVQYLQPPGWRSLAWALLLGAMTVLYAWLFSLVTERHTARLRAAIRRRGWGRRRDITASTVNSLK